MPLRIFKCETCGKTKETFKKAPKCCKKAMVKQLSVPDAKFMEPRDHVAKGKGKSTLKNQNKILRERTRNWSRDNEMHDLVQNNERDEAVRNHWINADGKVRKKIDDI